METKEKLTEIIGNVVVNDKGNRIRDVFHPEFVEKIVKDLIKNGAIVPPCKVGDILYMPLGKILEYEVISWRMREEGLQLVTHSRTTGGLYHIWATCIGKTIFLTREEAEAALKGE